LEGTGRSVYVLLMDNYIRINIGTRKYASRKSSSCSHSSIQSMWCSQCSSRSYCLLCRIQEMLLIPLCLSQAALVVRKMRKALILLLVLLLLLGIQRLMITHLLIAPSSSSVYIRRFTHSMIFNCHLLLDWRWSHWIEDSWLLWLMRDQTILTLFLKALISLSSGLR
jgi:hypothetical protein